MKCLDGAKPIASQRYFYVFDQIMLLKIGVVLFKVRIDIVPLRLLSQELLPLTLMRKGEDNQILTVPLRFGC